MTGVDIRHPGAAEIKQGQTSLDPKLLLPALEGEEKFTARRIKIRVLFLGLCISIQSR